jgi:hypothetical protein
VLGLKWEELIDREAEAKADSGSVQDWGEAPASSVFYGRSEELATLTQWIVNDRCRLVTLLGMGGIGKTALAVKWVELIQGQFPYFIWRSLRYAPPVEDILAQLIQFFWEQNPPNPPLAKGGKEEVIPDGFSARLSLLIDCLRKHRCLLVLDNLKPCYGMASLILKRCDTELEIIWQVMRGMGNCSSGWENRNIKAQL